MEKSVNQARWLVWPLFVMSFSFIGLGVYLG